MAREASDALREPAENLGVLASMLGEGRAYALAEEARPLLQKHRTADELALLSALFGLWAVAVGNEEVQAARWASLRSEHRPYRRKPGQKGE